MSSRCARSVVAALSLGALLLVLAGCGGEERPAALTVTDAWARATPEVATTGAVYLRIANGTDEDDVLVGAAVPAEIAGGLMLHRTTVTASDGGTDEMDSSAMEEMSRLDLPAGGTATLEPGGDHLMLMGLRRRLERGQAFDLELEFGSGARLTTTVEVRDP